MKKLIPGLILLSAQVLLAQPELLKKRSTQLDAQVLATPSGFQVLPNVAEYAEATLRVVGPQGELFRESFEFGREIVFDSIEALDGRYKWELVVWDRTANAPAEDADPNLANTRGSRRRASGSVSASRGLVKVDPEPGSVLGQGDGPASSPAANDSGLFFVESAATNNFAGSLSVTGNTCVGDGLCSASYDAADDLEVLDAFGSSVIRMMDDTSSGTRTVGWELETTNTLFFIEDIVSPGTPEILTLEEGAPDNALYVDSTGNIGIGTGSPDQDLHIATDSSPYIRLDNGTDFWDLRSNSSFVWFEDESAFPFVIASGAPSSSFRMDSNGRIGLGTATPTGNLHIFGNSSQDIFSAVGPSGSNDALNFGYSGSTFGQASGFFNVRPASGATAPNPALYFATGNVERMTIDNQGYIAVHQDAILANGFNPTHPIHAQVSGARLTAGGVWTNASSRALKENIGPLAAAEALAALQALEPVHYNYKLEPSDPQLGFIAEDVPEIVATPDRKGMAAIEVVALLTKVVQEQQHALEEQRQLIEELLRRTKGLDVDP
ncbi:MAG: tail fiber domain-containing protein [Acidobacteriota bacterium]